MRQFGARRLLRGSPSRLRSLLVSCLLAGVVVGCETRPSGPGSYLVQLRWDAGAAPLGGAQLFVYAGTGIGEISALDGARSWSEALPEDGGWVRVVLLHLGEPAELTFSVEVEDLRNGPPQVVLQGLTSQDNKLIPAGDEAYRVRVLGTP